MSATTPTLDEIDALTADLEDEVEPLELTELGLSQAVEDEMLIDYAYQHMRMALQTQYSMRANKAVGNDQEYERLKKVDLAARTVLGRLKKDHPRALQRAKEMAEQAVAQAA